MMNQKFVIWRIGPFEGFNSNGGAWQARDVLAVVRTADVSLAAGAKAIAAYSKAKGIAIDELGGAFVEEFDATEGSTGDNDE